jgi:monoamine oxidase
MKISDRAMGLSRRRLLQLTTGLAVARALPAAAALPRDVDVVVIGAGAAGLAAARRVVAANRKVVVLEASAVIGGRCQTDVTTFGKPFDRGARWLYNPDINPLVKLAHAATVDLATAPQGQKIRIGRRNARAGEAEDFLATLVRANRAIDDAARRGDIACAAVLPKDLREWAGTTEFLLGALGAGKDLKDLSVIDVARAQHRDTGAAPRQGLGALLTRLAEGLPIMLSTPATRIVWNNREVSVETAAGTIAARAAIVTASTGVLASGKIKFAPDLPKRQLDAAAQLSLGSYDHIALDLPGNPLGLSRDDVFIEQSGDMRTALLSANLGGSSLCLVDVGGSFGRDLSAQGEAAMIAFAIEWLNRLFGSDTAAAVKRSTATRWNADPYVLGAMSAAAPGGAAGRRTLTEPLGALFLAGEATSETDFGTVSGAWDSGERAADAALKKIGPAAKESEPARPAHERRSHPKPRPAPAPQQSSFFGPRG